MNAVLSQYPQLKDGKKPVPFGNGHINDTFLVVTPQRKFVLQRVNRKIFNTSVLVQNLSLLFEALPDYEKRNGIKLTPSFIKNRFGRFHTLDKEGAAWRLMEYFPGCRTYSISPDRKISFEAAQTTGVFQLFLNTLPVKKFGETIPRFHHPAGRLKVFLNTLDSAPLTLKKQAEPEIQFVLDQKNTALEWEKLVTSEKIPLRITHNDTKLENILFLPGKKALLIDLDTVMPGYIPFDFGDMVRTFCTAVCEDEKEPGRKIFRKEHFETLTRGYLAPLRNILTKEEKQSLLLGAKTIIYEQTLRFLNDFLAGNIYYKTAYPEHNLIRTRIQMKLLKEILLHDEALEEIIRNA